jgi:hypothetical protein
MDFIFFKSSWIPASAGMTTKNHVFLMFVSPAKAGVQLEAFKRKGPPTSDAQTIMDSLVTHVDFVRGEAPSPLAGEGRGEGDQTGKSLDSEIFITPTLPSPVEGEGENWDAMTD